MFAEGCVFLYFVKFLQEVGGVGVLLSVDCLLLHRVKDFAERHRSRVGAERSPGSQVDRVFHRPDLQSFDVCRGLDFMFAVSHLAIAVFHEANADKTAGLKRIEHFLAERAVKNFVDNLLVGEQERQVENHPFLVDRGERRAGRTRHFQGAGPQGGHCFDVVAKLGAGENLDFNASVGCFANKLFKLFQTFVFRTGIVQADRNSDNFFLRSRSRRSCFGLVATATSRQQCHGECQND